MDEGTYKVLHELILAVTDLGGITAATVPIGFERSFRNVDVALSEARSHLEHARAKGLKDGRG